MDKKKTLTKALGGVLVGGMLLSGGVALAANTNSTTQNSTSNLPYMGQAHHKGMFKHKGDFKFGGQKNFQANLDQFVKDGVITQDKATEIKTFIEKKGKERKARFEELKKLTPEQRKALREKNKSQKSETKTEGRQGIFGDLVKNNILTQQQADTIKTKLKENAEKQNQQRITDGLKALVNKGTITLEQSDKIVKKLEQAKSDRKALFEKLKGMTKEQRRQYMKDNKGSFNPLGQLVSDGTITKDQAKAIRETLFGHYGHGHKSEKQQNSKTPIAK